ncbi:flavin reductase [Actinoplanes sp. NPDC049548]|uniref:flavin reductase n=1 Tax=Actinoplanes sp. NPDC049548 TaxID=3155152 RepID=UPI00342AD0D9
MSVHQPVRPSWICGGCSLAWPCPTRRLELTAEYAGARVSLMVYLTTCFVEACHDNPDGTIGCLYDRFLTWPARPSGC